VIDFDIEISDNSHSKSNLKGKKKPNYQEQNDKNTALGERGEKIVLKHEKEFLNKEKLPLEKLEHSSKYDDRLGYDIKSCDINGKTKYIEVKSTRKKAGNTSLIITQNELDKAKELENYCIYIVFEADTMSPAIWKIENFAKKISKVKLTPINYRMEITVTKK